MTPEFAAGVRAARPDQVVKAGFFFRIDALPQELALGLRSNAAGRRADSQSELKAAIARGLAPAAALLRASGVTVEHTYGTIPLILGRAVPPVIEQVARSPMITLIVGTGESTFERHAAKNGVSDAHIDVSFNQTGHWGVSGLLHVPDESCVTFTPTPDST
jgi:hypothetical protein